MKNYERIKEMTVEEMAEVIICPYGECKYEQVPIKIICNECCKKWLESEE